MTVTHNFNVDPTRSESAIGEAVSIELETTAQQNQTQSSELVDPSPIDLATLLVIQEILNIVNTERGRVGLSPLRLHSQLTAAAQAHSDDMARHNFLSHTGSDGSSPFDRIKQYGYNFQWAGENIASGYSSPQDVMRGWMNSSGHRANILNPNFRDIGIGYARGNQPYWTQTFGA